jgi:ubiquinone/menaquinone biosynthesis C-methylase UbiE
VATVLQTLEQAQVTPDDVFVDVGAGIGRAALLAHLLTGAGCIGLEVQPDLVHAARARADWLARERMRFIEGDAVDLVRLMSTGTVFFFYCPFGQDRLHRILDDLQELARAREIRICLVDLPPVERPWLRAVPPMSVDVAVHWSTLHRPVRDPPTAASATTRARLRRSPPRSTPGQS